MTTNRAPRLLIPIALVSAMAFAVGCGAAAGGGSGSEQLGRESEALSSCGGVAIVGNRTDNDYCGFLKVKNTGTVSVKHWAVEADVASGVHVDYIDPGVTYTQSGTHVTFVPDAAHATLAAGASYEITYCNSNTASLLATSPIAKSELCSTSTTTTATTATTTATAPATTTTTTTTTTASTTTPLGKYVMTWYSFQDNTPVNSALSASGRPLLPYISVAVPFRLLKDFGGKLSYGDKLYVQYLAGRTMPNGTKHSGWVQIDDFCGDSGDDSYCFQSISGVRYPNVDLYIGDFTRSGMSSTTCSGPAGSGQELTSVSTGSPGSAWSGYYGGAALGSGKCGVLSTAKAQQACWDYTPPSSSSSECASCASFSCTSW